MRVCELAKELNVNARELLPRLAELRVDVRNQLTLLDDADVDLARRSIAQRPIVPPVREETPHESAKVTVQAPATALRQGMRVHELAKEMNVNARDLLARLAELRIVARNQLSRITDEQASLVRAGYRTTTKIASPPTRVGAPPLPANLTGSPSAATQSASRARANSTSVPPRQDASPQSKPDKLAQPDDTAVRRLVKMRTAFGLECLDNLETQNPSDAVLSMRKAAEALLRRILRRRRISLADAIVEVEGRISPKTKCMLHYIRSLGNVAAHESETFVREDVEQLAHALITVVEDFRRIGVIKSVSPR